MNDLNKLSLLIFDLDGTLVNSVYDYGDTLNKVLAQYNTDPFSYAEVQEMVGGGTLKLVSKAFERRGIARDLAPKAHDLFCEIYDQNLTNKTKTYLGVEETLAHFSNCRKAVLSNKPHVFTQKIIEELNLLPHFDLVLGAGNGYCPPKPDKDSILYILNKLQISPQEALIIGDSTHDIHAGQNAGIATCCVTYGYRSKAVLTPHQPTFFIDQMTDLINLIR